MPLRIYARIPPFPWLHSHGPIEAAQRRLNVLYTLAFRGYTATAPLKRRVREWLAIILEPFPWLHSHGPIEATRELVYEVRIKYAFRGYTATAPLKHCVLLSTCIITRTFRGYTATAPLKPVAEDDDVDDDADAFPWLHSHGPIEAAEWLAVVLEPGRSFRGYTATAPLKQRDRASGRRA